MRWIVCLAFFLPASVALAVIPPADPPWTCSVWASCDYNESCIPISPLSIEFTLTQPDSKKKTYDLHGADGVERLVLEMPSQGEAERFAENYKSDGTTPLIAIRDGIITDTNSFWLQGFSWRAGRYNLADAKMLITCQSIRKK